MNLRYLHYLRLVIAHGSFAAAAQAAGVSQPAVSHGMRQLQRHFGAPLFTRSGRVLVPTGVALQAASRSTDIAEQLTALTQAAHPAASKRDLLRVGLTPSAALVCGPVLYALWCDGRPPRRLDLASADEGRLLARLSAGELDLVISPRPRAWAGVGLACEPLYQITPQAYARRQHPLAKARSLTELQAAPWAIVGPSVAGPVDVLQEAFAVRRMPPPRVVASCPDYACLLQLMTHADLLAVLPHPALLASSPPGQIVPLRLQEALPRYEMHLFAPARSRRRWEALLTALRQSLAVTDDDAKAPPPRAG
ncbi:MAG TPA: LysR family transcriptional regulator [Ideonella sp.]|uniref:LysR family transcriptional regulator n=1 Tax=Ideonella sp. TaxID=1929293 RepID=UPI002BE7882F|nr:LysR family transcriptional regulator [Ideonella sp.]HSI47649.1 LysR family transcriptional regulator [Ideonella sp.]